MFKGRKFGFSKYLLCKCFGQNFLYDLNVIQNIVDVIVSLFNDNMVEIGFGLGVLIEYLVDEVG